MDQNYDEVLYKAHLEEIFSSLLVHMDDKDCELQLIVKSKYFIYKIYLFLSNLLF